MVTLSASPRFSGSLQYDDTSFTVYAGADFKEKLAACLKPLEADIARLPDDVTIFVGAEKIKPKKKRNAFVSALIDIKDGFLTPPDHFH